MTRPADPDIPPEAEVEPPASQTLDRGLRVLEHVAASARPLLTGEVARDMELHRSITYRMLRTLEARRLVRRDGDGAWLPASGLAVLASNVVPDVRVAAQSVLESLAHDTAMTAFLVIRDHDEAVTASVVEPRTAIAHVTYRPGRRHPVTRGAPGIALLAGESSLRGERPEVPECRARGWAFTESEVLPGMKACAAPVVTGDATCTAAISVVFVGEPDLEILGQRVARAAGELAVRTMHLEDRSG